MTLQDAITLLQRQYDSDEEYRQANGFARHDDDEAMRLLLDAAKRIEPFCQQHTGDLRCCRCWDL